MWNTLLFFFLLFFWKTHKGLREKFLGNNFWLRVRQRLGSLGIHGMFNLKEWKKADTNYQSTMLYKRRLEVMMKNNFNYILPKILKPSKSAHEKILEMLEKIDQYRPFKTASIVDMNNDDSCGLAWELSCTALAKTAAIECILNEEENESILIEKHHRIHGGRKQIPGNSLYWIELTESIYRPKMWRWMSDQGGYSIAMRIKQGCTACEERAKLKEMSISTLLHDLAASGQEKYQHGKGNKSKGQQAASLRFDEKIMRARNSADRRAEGLKFFYFFHLYQSNYLLLYQILHI